MTCTKWDTVWLQLTPELACEDIQDGHRLSIYMMEVWIEGEKDPGGMEGSIARKNRPGASGTVN